jgi:hypothetical protein
VFNPFVSHTHVRFAASVAVAVGLAAAACGGEDTPVALHTGKAGTYPGELRSARCAKHWFTGSDATARFSCAPGGYRIAFTEPGQDTSLTRIEPAAMMQVDAIVRAAPPRRAHPGLAPGVGCFKDGRHGWIAQLTTNSAYVVVEYGSSNPLASGTSPAVLDVHEWNHVVLTCDATGSETTIGLTVNGKLVVDAVPAGKPVRFNRFGAWAAGEPGAALEVRGITATTR